jgi:hypothetical protein
LPGSSSRRRAARIVTALATRIVVGIDDVLSFFGITRDG